MSFLFASSRWALAIFGLCIFGFVPACGGASDDGDGTATDNAPITISQVQGTTNFRSVRHPAIYGIAPTHGALSGGTTIVVNGRNFGTETTLTIGGIPCANVVRVSSSEIDAVTPASATGTYDVVATSTSGLHGTLTSAFTYEAASPSVAPPPPVTTSAPTSLRGTNLVGMEGDYSFNQANGPVPDTDYAVHSTQIIDYLATKNVNVLRFLFSWERMQSTLNGPIPASTSGNYKSYFDDYKRIVDYATTVKGMTVIMEPWQASPSGDTGGPSWRGNVVGGGIVTSAHFADFWSKMASVYASNPRVAIGLVNEPNNMSTMTWFSAAQAAVTAIRSAGFTGTVYVPGNGWTSAGTFTDSSYDTGSPQRSNAYGWMNARGVGLPLTDPLSKLVVSVHAYADSSSGGGATDIVSSTISRSRIGVAVDWARANGLTVFVGEIGMYASAPNAAADWSDFVSYIGANADTLRGFTWWGCGKPGWWDDVGASGGGHFSITPTSNYTTDTVNMKMIAPSFGL